MNSTTYGVDEYGNEGADIRSGYVGEIKMFGYSGVPAHCLACDGSLLSIAAYPELYAKLGTQHGGDGVTTFALPTAEDVIYAAGNGRVVGASVVEGLPNITGETGVRPAKESLNSGTDNVYTTVEETTNEGAFLGSGAPSGANLWAFALGIGDSFSDGQFHFPSSPIKFDASKSNPIYGASTHVQPKGTAFNFCIVYE